MSQSRVEVVQQNRTAHLQRALWQLVGAGSVRSYAGGPRGYECTWDDIGLTWWSISGRRRVRPRQEPRDTAMA